ncbi:MAG: nickel-dependent lactate racemase [Clostridiales bacterium]|nr:nickel-dependent lactate racemase [Clostridiales bacterium]
MKLEFAIGNRVDSAELPQENLLGVLMANEVKLGLTGEEEVRRALMEPIGTPRLKDLVKPGEKIAIITSDITRPMPTYAVMPALLEELIQVGVDYDDVTVVFGLGIHRQHTPEEQRKLIGEFAFSKVRCADSNEDDVLHMGDTKAGTPIDVSRVVAEADRRICLGNIEYHYFAGYSGGGKAIMPGVSTRAAIESNHRMMVQPEACAGRLDGNPIREDIEEAAAVCGVDFILNVVLDEHKRIVKAVAGDSILAHREGCRFLDKFYLKEIDKRADIVIVSQGGAPKDLNLYQTQKALDNAKHAVKKGGTIIVVGSCVEGFGDETFECWIKEAKKPQDLIDRVNRQFVLGGHKAAAIALVQQNAEIYLVSDMEDNLVRSCFMTPFSTVQQALEYAFKKQGPLATVLAMPYGGSTLPRVRGEFAT